LLIINIFFVVKNFYLGEEMKLLSHLKHDFQDKEIIFLHPEQNFNSESIVEVLDSQEAIFVKNGKTLDVLPPGRHVLQTENIPLLKNLIHLPNNGNTTFTSRLYFINMKHNFDFFWGTRTPMSLLDPIYNIILPVGSSGHSIIKINDAKKFYIKFSGSKSTLTMEEIISSFKSITSTHIKDLLSETILKEKVSIIQINTLLLELSEILKINLNKVFHDYGINIEYFSIENISVNESDPSFIKLKNAIAKKSEMSILGYDYNTERKYDVLEGAAKNEGSGGQIIGAGIGLGVGASMGSQFGRIFEDKMDTSNQNISCQNCNNLVDSSSNFCKHCGIRISINICKSCGSKTTGGLFCSKCGSKL